MWYTGARLTARLHLTSRGNDEAKFSASRPVEIAQSRERISESAPPLSPSSRERGGEIHGEVEGKFSASQSIEIARNREGISESASRISHPRSHGEASGVGLFGPVDQGLEVSRPTAYGSSTLSQYR